MPVAGIATGLGMLVWYHTLVGRSHHRHMGPEADRILFGHSRSRHSYTGHWGTQKWSTADGTGVNRRVTSGMCILTSLWLVSWPCDDAYPAV